MIDPPTVALGILPCGRVVYRNEFAVARSGGGPAGSGPLQAIGILDRKLAEVDDRQLGEVAEQAVGADELDEARVGVQHIGVDHLVVSPPGAEEVLEDAQLRLEQLAVDPVGAADCLQLIEGTRFTRCRPSPGKLSTKLRSAFDRKNVRSGANSPSCRSDCGPLGQAVEHGEHVLPGRHVGVVQEVGGELPVPHVRGGDVVLVAKDDRDHVHVALPAEDVLGLVTDILVHVQERAARGALRGREEGDRLRAEDRAP